MNADSRKVLDLANRQYDGFNFWSLAPADQAIRRRLGVKAADTEFVWLTNPAGHFVKAVVRLADGSVLEAMF